MTISKVVQEKLREARETNQSVRIFRTGQPSIEGIVGGNGDLFILYHGKRRTTLNEPEHNICGIELLPYWRVSRLFARVSERDKRNELQLLFAGAGPVLKESLYVLALSELHDADLERVQRGSKELAEHLDLIEKRLENGGNQNEGY